MIQSPTQKIFTILHYVIANPESVNKSDWNGNNDTPLLLACSNNIFKNEVERLLLIPNINVNQCNIKGTTPLRAASFTNSIGAVKALLTHKDIDINAKSEILGSNALMLACALGHIDIIKILLQHDATNVDDTNIVPGCLTALKFSQNNFTSNNEGNVSRAQYILSPKTGKDLRKNLSPLFFAIEYNNSINKLSSVKLLLSYGANINHQCSYGNTALHFALYEEEYDIAETLIKYGCSIDMENSKSITARDIIIACKNKHFDYLLEISNNVQILIDQQNKNLDLKLMDNSDDYAEIFIHRLSALLIRQFKECYFNTKYDFKQFLEQSINSQNYKSLQLILKLTLIEDNSQGIENVTTKLSHEVFSKVSDMFHENLSEGIFDFNLVKFVSVNFADGLECTLADKIKGELQCELNNFEANSNVPLEKAFLFYEDYKMNIVQKLKLKLTGVCKFFPGLMTKIDKFCEPCYMSLQSFDLVMLTILNNKKSYHKAKFEDKDIEVKLSSEDFKLPIPQDNTSENNVLNKNQYKFAYVNVFNDERTSLKLPTGITKLNNALTSVILKYTDLAFNICSEVYDMSNVEVRDGYIGVHVLNLFNAGKLKLNLLELRQINQLKNYIPKWISQRVNLDEIPTLIEEAEQLVMNDYAEIQKIVSKEVCAGSTISKRKYSDFCSEDSYEILCSQSQFINHEEVLSDIIGEIKT